MLDITAKLKILHTAYNRLTGRSMQMTSADLFRWEVWDSHGWTEADLALVVAFIHRRIKAQRRWQESFRLHNLIDPARFADDLQDARGEARIPVTTPRDRALQSIGRPQTSAVEARTPAQIMAGEKAFAEFRAWKEANL